MPGDEVRYLLYQGTEQDDISEILSSIRCMLQKSPVLFREENKTFGVRLTGAIIDHNNPYNIIGIGVVI